MLMKKIFSVILFISIIALTLFGCSQEQEISDPVIFKDGTFSIGMLVPDGEEIYTNCENGFLFANSLANYVSINNEEVYNYYSIFNYTADDIVLNAQNLVDQGVSVIVFCGEDLNSFNEFTNYIKDTNIPVVSLSPYTCDYDRFYSLPLSKEYQASCSATYALDKGYTNSAVLCQSDDQYYRDFAGIYKNTFKSYIGTEPAVYYKTGESANYTGAAFVSGNYDYLFLICPSENRMDTVNDLRSNGYNGEIMFNEVFDHTVSRFSMLNNCSFMTKLENDPSNNISTVFYSEFSENFGINSTSVTSAAAYGYDAHMTIFEALKSFADNDSSSFFKNETPTSTTTSEESEIKLSDFVNALENVAYNGVTDIIKLKDHKVVPTYIYVDNIVNSEISLSNKYTFSDK